MSRASDVDVSSGYDLTCAVIESVSCPMVLCCERKASGLRVVVLAPSFPSFPSACYHLLVLCILFGRGCGAAVGADVQVLLSKACQRGWQAFAAATSPIWARWRAVHDDTMAKCDAGDRCFSGGC